MMASPVDFMVDLAQIAIEAAQSLRYDKLKEKLLPSSNLLHACYLCLFHFSNISKQLKYQENCFMVQKLTVHASGQQSHKVFHNHP